jgi:ankyrin repeat protein
MKKNINTLFSAIRNHENATVRALLADNPALVNVCASAPPKKDDGQSPLQVAFKTGNFEMAAYLIDLGANIHFMEESQINKWRTPVLHDALSAAVFSARDGQIVDHDHFTAAIALVRRLLDLGADPNAVDSNGNTALIRALLDSRQRLVLDPGFPDRVENQRLNRELREVFQSLIAKGADIHAGHSNFGSAKAFASEKPALAQLLQ